MKRGDFNKDSELIIGIIHTVGTNSAEIIQCIIDSLNKFRYSSEVIKVSKEILVQFGTEAPCFSGEYDRIHFFMDKGNTIRDKTEDDAILMKGVCAYIYNKYRLNSEEAPQLRRAYIIDSIKHPDEVEFLRQTYGDGFHLIGISDTYERRKSFLMDRKNMSEEQAERILDRDNNEKEKNGQHTGDAYQQSDYFINAGDSRDEMQENVFRLLDLLFGNPFISPTFEEYAMFRAYVASLRSADLSRQIGVVVTRGDEVLAEGVNDCPKAFGGLYWPVYKNGKYLDEKQGRDYTLGYDSNKIEQKKIVEDILVELGLELSNENIKKIKATGIGALTEFGRVVHGEMEALLMCARNGISTKGCSMYMTTFPCHNCAKHIIAAGIKKVVYIEPYPKSKALDFYKNEISQNEQDQNDKVVFSAFKGVGPHRFVDLFSMQSIRWYSRTRKNKDGYIVQWNRGEANLRNPMALLSYIEMERSAYKQYAEEIAGIGKENEDGRKNSN
ncbi:MAG: cytidine deaminase [Lachnospiraceae bacterium]|nr:cytidine deaminase [Lachnospiraceae bacterium]